MKKICAVSGQEFLITDEDLAFYEKMGVPIPTLCPEERQRRRIAFRNFRSLYHRKCDATGKQLISMYHADHPFPVYDNDYWWGDNWNGKTYGRDFDPGSKSGTSLSRSFFEQYAELAREVPRFAILNLQCENCRYSNFAWGSRNCYLVFGCVRDEDCLYGHIVWDSKNCVDNLYVYRCEWCSNCVDCVDCYDVHFSTECANCNESYFLHDCRGCTNCFGCTNLRNKQYCWLNEQCTKEEYFKKLKAVQPFTHQTITDGKTWLEKLKRTECVFPPMFGVKNENVSGNHLYECKNVHHSFDAKQCEDSKYLYTSHGQNHCYDFSFTGARTSFCLDCLTVHDSTDLAFCHGVNYASDVQYSEFCFNSHDLFGCHGLRNAEYCILNKQYPKEEYFALRERIIEHMKHSSLPPTPSLREGEQCEYGEFFPIELSPFAYNESIVQEYFPLTKQEVLERGWQWREDTESAKYDGPIYEIPASITDVDDAILDAILTCSETGKNYRVVKSELAFYRRMGLPIPRICPDARHEERMALRNPRLLWQRQCAVSETEIMTSFAPDRPEKILCEEEYLKVVQ